MSAVVIIYHMGLKRDEDLERIYDERSLSLIGSIKLVATFEKYDMRSVMWEVMTSYLLSLAGF